MHSVLSVQWTTQGNGTRRGNAQTVPQCALHSTQSKLNILFIFSGHLNYYWWRSILLTFSELWIFFQNFLHQNRNILSLPCGLYVTLFHHQIFYDFAKSCLYFLSVSLLRPSHIFPLWRPCILRNTLQLGLLLFLEGTLCCSLLTFPLCCGALMTI